MIYHESTGGDAAITDNDIYHTFYRVLAATVLFVQASNNICLLAGFALPPLSQNVRQMSCRQKGEHALL
jgi:hypothetical protein